MLAVMSGCSSIDRDIAFDGAPDKAFLLVAADGMDISGTRSYLFEFRKVNLAASTLLDSRIAVNFSGMGPIEGDEFDKPEQLKTLVRFGGKPVTPGDYALTSRYDFTSLGTLNTTDVHCFALGAPVFHIHEGGINIVPAGNVGGGTLHEEILPSQVSAVMANYPKMTAPLFSADLIGAIVFKTEPGLLGNQACNLSGPFKFMPREGR